MKEGFIYALGFFDGVHLGHQALLNSCRELSQLQGCRSGAVTFGTHPEELVLGKALELINTPRDRERLLLQQGQLDRVVTLRFDEQLRTMAWEDFLDMLMDVYGARGFVCGDDFRCGYRGAGDVQKLQGYCREHGIPLRVIPEQLCDGHRISSTYIRRQLEDGNVENANRFLGHPHVLSGTVVPGKQLGRQLGVPTANLVPQERLVRMRHGVYACRCAVDGVVYTAVTNVGTRPTVDGVGVTVEPWLLGYDGNLYGKELSLEFYSFIRPEHKFRDLEELKNAIREDARKAKELLG